MASAKKSSKVMKKGLKKVKLVAKKLFSCFSQNGEDLVHTDGAHVIELQALPPVNGPVNNAQQTTTPNLSSGHVTSPSTTVATNTSGNAQSTGFVTTSAANGQRTRPAGAFTIPRKPVPQAATQTPAAGNNTNQPDGTTAASANAVNNQNQTTSGGSVTNGSNGPAQAAQGAAVQAQPSGNVPAAMQPNMAAPNDVQSANNSRVPTRTNAGPAARPLHPYLSFLSTIGADEHFLMLEAAAAARACPNNPDRSPQLAIESDHDVVWRHATESPPAFSEIIPAFLTHGVRYQPDHTVDSAPHRTVLVYDLGKDVTLYDITKKVPDGWLAVSQLLPQPPFVDRLTARLVFFDGNDAVHFYQQSIDERSPLIVNGRVARVVLVNTPSYPIVNCRTLRKWSDIGATEKLIIRNFDKRSQVNVISAYLLVGREAVHVDGIQHIERLEDGGIYVVFSSVEVSVWCARGLSAETEGAIVSEFV